MLIRPINVVKPELLLILLLYNSKIPVYLDYNRRILYKGCWLVQGKIYGQYAALEFQFHFETLYTCPEKINLH
jgi:hypothetical protein